ncbi:ribose-phosphate pyrophosphokinase [Flammeovirga agarivorans]|uniref:ribose-phosphate diphosphokinase n=1 Tax=Flammeovirga agarivorans TaxID=2726742 RepID=A0A7X8SMH0_9BACT|nr:ribose-phosphate pyrophosphokinase [Flammeovirga agarivorans]NLR92862.1 ribose-phosphate pyrophosphokinase [Flammeovirga agarivorans]
MSSVKIFSASGTEYLASKIAHSYGKSLGDVVLQRFSDGEISTHFNESVRGCDVFIIQSTCPPADNLLELLLLIDAAKRASASTVTVLLPYFGYARQDRKDKPRVGIGAKLIANLLTASGATRVVTCELHADQIQGFFDIPVVHLQSSPIFVPYIESLGLDNLTFASPDVGGAKRARSYAKHFKSDIVMCDKHRERANEVASMQVIGDVKDKNVILIDDLVDTAGTLCNAAEIIMEKGAKSVRAICTHGVLSGPAYDRVAASKLEELVVTDTLPVENREKVHVLSVAELFAKAIRKIQDHESISSLFI